VRGREVVGTEPSGGETRKWSMSFTGWEWAIVCEEERDEILTMEWHPSNIASYNLVALLIS
jgi:hypothetical protein